MLAALNLSAYPKITKTTINFNDANLASAGKTIYTPAVGDLLLNVWVEIITVWNGTTPKGDFGTFTGNGGLYALYGSTTFDMTQSPNTAITGNTTLTDPGNNKMFAQSTTSFYRGSLRFNSAANTLKFVVSQSGQKGGTDPGATQGQCNVYVATVTP